MDVVTWAQADEKKVAEAIAANIICDKRINPIAYHVQSVACS